VDSVRRRKGCALKTDPTGPVKKRSITANDVEKRGAAARNGRTCEEARCPGGWGAASGEPDKKSLRRQKETREKTSNYPTEKEESGLYK